ncbi:protoporphyrinogen/coproporphyrinogen oxidase [Helicobacter sp. 23-1045]
MKKQKALVLGAGIAGISAAYHLQDGGKYEVYVYEKNSDWGGLCGGFWVDSAKGKFWFDNAVHLSFTSDNYAKSTFHTNAPPLTHIPNPINYYENIAIKHPAQNNLCHLPLDIKISALKDMIGNKNKNKICNYEDWLRAQYGDFFTENFVKKYTRKYWTLEARELSTSWVGGRFYMPNLEEILRGAMSDETPNTYYAQKMHYPKEGQYRSFVKNLAQNLNITYKKEAVEINAESVTFSDGSGAKFDKLISTLPINEIVKLLKNIPQKVKNAAAKLHATSVAIVSFGFKRADVAKNLWFYSYDEDKLFARVYSPSLKSPSNAPKGCSSLQAEIYFSAFKPLENMLGIYKNPPPIRL